MRIKVYDWSSPEYYRIAAVMSYQPDRGAEVVLPYQPLDQGRLRAISAALAMAADGLAAGMDEGQLRDLIEAPPPGASDVLLIAEMADGDCRSVNIGGRPFEFYVMDYTNRDGSSARYRWSVVELMGGGWSWEGWADTREHGFAAARTAALQGIAQIEMTYKESENPE